MKNKPASRYQGLAVEKTVTTSLNDIFDITHQIAATETPNLNRLKINFLYFSGTSYFFILTISKNTINQTRIKIFRLYKK